MRYFLSDLHIGDPRLELYQRDLTCKNFNEVDSLVLANYNNIIKDDDVVYFLGDVVYDINYVENISKFNGKKILIVGNYDEKHLHILKNYFNEIYNDLIINIDGIGDVYLNHFPSNGKHNIFSIVGHIHGLWKVQRNMINVGVDAWNFNPVSEEKIKFLYNAIKKHFDINVFAGELFANKSNI